MSEVNPKELFVDAFTSLSEDIIQESFIESIDNETIKGILKHCTKIRNVKKSTLLDAVPTEMLAKEFCESLNKNGFGVIPDPLLLIICEQYISHVIKGALTDTEFEFLTQEVGDTLKDRYETQKIAEEETNKVLAPKGMCI